MKLLVGLGNPGSKYTQTRHNVGYMIVDKLISDARVNFSQNTKIGGSVAVYDNFVFFKSNSFMNNVGPSVSKALSFYHIKHEDLIVFHDDVDLPFCVYKKHFAKNSGGHHGVEDIITSLGTNGFWRLRYGIGRPLTNSFAVEDWVLQKFTADELNTLTHTIKSIELQTIIGG